MATLQSMTYITVTATYTLLDGTPCSGKVYFESRQVLVGPEGVVEPLTFVAELDANGAISIDLPATDDPDYEPTGWVYKVSEDTTGHNRPTFNLSLPHDGGNVDLKDVAVPGPVEETGLTSDDFTLLTTFNDHDLRHGPGGVDEITEYARGDGTLSVGQIARIANLDPLTLEPLGSPSDGDAAVYNSATGQWEPDSDTYRKVTVNAKGPNDSITTRVNDALTAGGENTHVYIEGDEGLIDAPIVLQDRYQRVESSAETHLWVPSGYAQSAFKLYASGGANNYNMSIAVWGTLREKDDTSLAYNWTAFEVHADGGSPNYPRIETGPFIWYAGVGLKLRLSGTTHSITGGRFSVLANNPQVGVEFVRDDTTRDPSISRNYFDMAQCQYSSVTTRAFKNVFGQGNVFVCPTMWDVGTHAPDSTPFEVSADATDTVIIGSDPHLEAGTWLADNGVNTTIISPTTSSFTRENHLINLSASAMEASIGSPTRATAEFRYPTWKLADSENQGASGFLDDDEISHGTRTMRVYLVMNNEDGNSGTTAMKARVHQPLTNLADGQWPNHGPEEVLTATVTLPTDGRPQLVDMGTFEHKTGQRELHIQAFREPANDDMTGSVYLWKAKLERE